MIFSTRNGSEAPYGTKPDIYFWVAFVFRRAMYRGIDADQAAAGADQVTYATYEPHPCPPLPPRARHHLDDMFAWTTLRCRKNATSRDMPVFVSTVLVRRSTAQRLTCPSGRSKWTRAVKSGATLRTDPRGRTQRHLREWLSPTLRQPGAHRLSLCSHSQSHRRLP